MKKINRQAYLEDKFGKMGPYEFVEYHKKNPECPYAHEYITIHKKPRFVSTVLEIIERIELIK